MAYVRGFGAVSRVPGRPAPRSVLPPRMRRPGRQALTRPAPAPGQSGPCPPPSCEPTSFPVRRGRRWSGRVSRGRAKLSGPHNATRSQCRFCAPGWCITRDPSSRIVTNPGCATAPTRAVQDTVGITASEAPDRGGDRIPDRAPCWSRTADRWSGTMPARLLRLHSAEGPNAGSRPAAVPSGQPVASRSTVGTLPLEERGRRDRPTRLRFRCSAPRILPAHSNAGTIQNLILPYTASRSCRAVRSNRDGTGPARHKHEPLPWFCDGRFTARPRGIGRPPGSQGGRRLAVSSCVRCPA